MIEFSAAATAAVQAVYDDPRRHPLADRLEAMLDLLQRDAGDAQVHRHRMRSPGLWAIFVSGSGEDWALLWDEDDAGTPYVHYAGPSWS